MAEERLDALPEGYQLDRYRIKHTLGDGGFGITYLAYHVQMGDAVAIKEYLPVEFAIREANSTVLPRGGKASETYTWGLKRFLDEAKTLAKFKDHPNIVSVRDYFEANGTAYLVMQYEQGQDFSEWLKKHPTPDQQQLLNIIIPILDGLREVHAQHYLHRDIKPSNIYIRDDGRPLLIDFGASRLALGEHSRSLTNIITPGYSPKEQYSSTGKQGAWTDIYASGASLWRAISGEQPALAGDRAEARDDDLPDPLHPAMEIGKGRYSDGFLRAIDWALCYLPKDRPQSIQAWQAVLLQEWQSTENVVQKPPKPVKPIKHERKKQKQIAKQQDSTQTDKPIWQKTAGITALLLAVTLVSYWLGQQDQQPATQAAVQINHSAEQSGLAAVEPEAVTPDEKPPELENTKNTTVTPSRLAFEPNIVDIPAGSFQMGCLSNDDDCYDNEKPAHRVTISAFSLSRTEITFSQWQYCVEGGGCQSNPSPDDEGWGKGDRPVINVSWGDTQEYVQWLKEKTGKNYRLPTEAEWEYAARAGTNTKYSWGNEKPVCSKTAKNGASHNGGKGSDCYYNPDDTYRGTEPVGSYTANAWGLYDMHGNVWEWVQDRWHNNYKSNPPKDGMAWESGSGDLRMFRGGSWVSGGRSLRSAYRSRWHPGFRSNFLGFRLVLGH